MRMGFESCYLLKRVYMLRLTVYPAVIDSFEVLRGLIAREIPLIHRSSRYGFSLAHFIPTTCATTRAAPQRHWKSGRWAAEWLIDGPSNQERKPTTPCPNPAIYAIQGIITVYLIGDVCVL